MEMDEELFDVDADSELHGDQLLVATRVAAARRGDAIRMGVVIEQIIARDNLARPVSPPTQMPAPPTPQRARPSGVNAHLHRSDVASTLPMKRNRSDQSGRRAVRAQSLTSVITSRRKTLRRSRRDAGIGRDAERIHSLTLRQA